VSSIPFAEANFSPEQKGVEGTEGGNDVLKIMERYKRLIVNLLLVAAAFFLIVRPLLRALKKVSKETVMERRELPEAQNEYEQIESSGGENRKERILELSRSNPEKTQQLIKGWIGDQE
jgi:flagellar biosynthesis/type III secretory pathway M-ring protein FliF/YscJ